MGAENERIERCAQLATAFCAHLDECGVCTWQPFVQCADGRTLLDHVMATRDPESGVDWKARAEAAEADRDEWKQACVDGNTRFQRAETENAALRERVATNEARYHELLYKVCNETSILDKATDAERHTAALRRVEFLHTYAGAYHNQDDVKALRERVATLAKQRVDLCDAAMRESTSNEEAVDCIRATRLERDALREKLAVALSKLDAPSRSAGGTIARTTDDGERRGNIHGKKLGVD